MTPIEKNSEITITLRAEEWNQLLNLIAEGPYKTAAPLIQRITQQAEEATKKI